ncbi:unnamed protein product [Chrysoparadoxa australica]
MTQEKEERFGHLLQPIRDLAANWDIDVAASLEGYLEELENVTISLESPDGSGPQKLNFAEAALLIQGSTSIYSKKVEHLYKLVLQTIEHLAAQQFGKNGKTTKEGSPCSPEGVEEQEAVFLCLDDVQEGKNIDLVAETGPINSKSSVSISRPPLFLVEQDHGNHFKMSTCTVDKSGALLIEGARLLGPEANAGHDLGTEDEDGEVGAWVGLGAAADHVLQGEEGGEVELGGGGGDSDSDNGSYQAGGFDMHDDAPEYDAGAEGIAPRVQGDAAELRQGQNQAKAQAPQVVDPWAPLDPYDPGTHAAKLFRKGRTFVLPEGLRKQPKKRRSTAADTHDRDNTAISLVVGLGGLVYGEFQYIARRERARKNQQQRKARMAANGAGVDESHYYSDDDDFGEMPVYDGGCDSDMGDDEAMPAYDEEALFGDAAEHEAVGPISLEQAFLNAPQSYEELCQSHIKAFLKGAEQYANETQLSKRVTAWQSKLEPLLRTQETRDPFDIHRYGANIIQRSISFMPASLRRKLQELAADGPKGKETDVSDFTADEADTIVQFKDVVAGKARFDVCRMFLASLQLANAGNVRLLHGETVQEQAFGNECLQLELLSVKTESGLEGHHHQHITLTLSLPQTAHSFLSSFTHFR